MMNEEKAKGLGVKEYLMKPVLRNKLSASVRKALRGQEVLLDLSSGRDIMR